VALYCLSQPQCENAEKLQRMQSEEKVSYTLFRVVICQCVLRLLRLRRSSYIVINSGHHVVGLGRRRNSTSRRRWILPWRTKRPKIRTMFLALLRTVTT
jgi:hypothetical protein